MGEDGTPNDSLEDVAVRVKQLLSKLETQYFAADVLVVAPDSTNLSVFEALLKNVDIRDHERFAYKCGEARAVDPVIVKRAAPAVIPLDSA
mmetsp:Transcript_7535/g.19730  ORF Transcript_7535/g.19730 Transcript_7535/m.19730 type:complete len:91 (+) Transcript_7535:109-381(+)